jgi:O2-independent ubiquinone biosynthesis accessory factor UbiT
MPALPPLPSLPSLSLPGLPTPTQLFPQRLRQRLGAHIDSLRVPLFTLPPAVAKIAARLPQRVPTQALTLALNLALDRILPRDTLSPLIGRHLQMRVLDAGLTLDFTLNEQGFRRSTNKTPDLILSATARDYLALALREEDPDTLFFSRRLRMEGDTDLGLLVKNTLDAVDWDALKAKILGLPPG